LLRNGILVFTSQPNNARSPTETRIADGNIVISSNIRSGVKADGNVVAAGGAPKKGERSIGRVLGAGRVA
jgi:hypothetical protein